MVREVNTLGIINTIAGTGTAGYNGDGILATSAQLSSPEGVVVDAKGNIYIADVGNQRIREIVSGDTITFIYKLVSYNEDLNLYPNPASTQLTIMDKAGITTIVISNLLGQVVYSSQYNSLQVQVDVTDLSEGIYFVKVNGSEIRKFVKQ